MYTYKGILANKVDPVADWDAYTLLNKYLVKQAPCYIAKHLVKNTVIGD